MEDQERLPTRERGEIEISAPISVPYTPLPARTRVLLATAALLAVVSILAVTIPAAQRGLAAQRAQATQTAATIRLIGAARATETTYVRRAIATQTAAATVAAASTTAYSAAVPGCPLGDPLWQTQNFDPANPNYVCAADGLQILTGARPHFGLNYCLGCQLAARHEMRIHFYDIQPNVAYIQFLDGLISFTLHMDGSWQLYGPLGLLAGGTHALPREFTMRIRYDGSQATVAVNAVTCAVHPLAISDHFVGGVAIDFASRDYSQPSAIRVRDFSFTPLP